MATELLQRTKDSSPKGPDLKTLNLNNREHFFWLLVSAYMYIGVENIDNCLSMM